MLVGGLGQAPLTIHVEGNLVTDLCGVTQRMVTILADALLMKTTASTFSNVRVTGGLTYRIEPDASAANYPAGPVPPLVDHYRPPFESWFSTGDVGFADILAKPGACGNDPTQITVTDPQLRGIDVDMHHISDTVMSIAAIAR